MNWANLLFLHWRVDPAVMRVIVPGPLEIDVYDGSAWIGLVPFSMEDCEFRGFNWVPGTANFHECNVRTYVRIEGKIGVWFLSLDAQSLLAVLGGRWDWSLNYIHSRFAVSRTGDVIDYSVDRRRGPWPAAHTRVKWRTGELLPPSVPGSLEHFLTERYWLFTRRRGRTMAGEVRHVPWPLRRAELLELDDTLIAAAGVKVSGEPFVLASEHLAVDGYGLRGG